MKDLKLHMVGLSAHEIERELSFYTDVLGMQAARGEQLLWALLADGWGETEGQGARGLNLGVLGGANPPLEGRDWGKGQNLRPGIQVIEPQDTISRLHQYGLVFAIEHENQIWREVFEFSDPEGIRWTLGLAAGMPSGFNTSKPHIGWVDLKAADFDRQKSFYSQVLGLGVDEQNKSLAFLMGERGEPFIVLTPGGERVAAPAGGDDPRASYPVWLSFETGDVRAVFEDLKARNVVILRDLTPHPDWGGLDLIIADMDGNAVQIVQQNAV